MEKIIKGLIAFAILAGVLLPSIVVAGCPNRWYEVSYFDESHDWTIQRVSAQTGYIAAWELGLDAGHGCIVLSVGVDHEPRTFWYKVSYFDTEHNWTSEYVKAQNRNKASEQFGFKDSSRGCIVTRAIDYQRTLLSEDAKK